MAADRSDTQWGPSAVPAVRLLKSEAPHQRTPHIKAPVSETERAQEQPLFTGSHKIPERRIPGAHASLRLRTGRLKDEQARRDGDVERLRWAAHWNGDKFVAGLGHLRR